MEGEAKKKLELLVIFLVGILPFELNGLYNPLLEKHTFYFWSADVAAWVFLPAAVYIWGVRRGLFTRFDLGFHFDIFGRKEPIVYFLTPHKSMA